MTRYRSAPALLSLPSDLVRPNAYQVFGLRVGESDPQTVSNAIRSTIQRLNELKSEADSEAWRQAAKWVKAARDELVAVVTKPKVADPLAGLLPGHSTSSAGAPPSAVPASEARPSLRPGSTRPEAGIGPFSGGGPIASPPPPNPPPSPVPPSTSLPTSPERMADVRPTPPAESWPSPGEPVAAWPPGEAAETVAAEIASPPVAAGQWVSPAVVIEEPVRSSGRRVANRRATGFPWVNAFLMLFAFACLLAVGGLVYVMSKNPGGLVISLQTGSDPGDAAPSQPVRSGAAPLGGATRGGVEPRRGESSSERVGRADRASATGRDTRMAEADRWIESLAGDSAEPGTPAQAAAANPAADPAAMPMATAESPAAMADQPGDAADEPMIATEGAATDEGAGAGMGPGQETGAAALAAARLALRQADWQGMIPAAAAATAAAITPEQKLSARRLEELADLAEYYHAGIEAGLDKLKATESFALTEQLQVVVVEISPERLVVRFSGQNKEYPRQELPLVLAHKIVRFALPTESPVVPIAAAVYDAIAPVSTAPYREKAIKTLESMTEEIEGIRPSDLAVELSEVLATSAGSE